MVSPIGHMITGTCKHPECDKTVIAIVGELTRKQILEKLRDPNWDSQVFCDGRHRKEGSTLLDNFDWNLPKK